MSAYFDGRHHPQFALPLRVGYLAFRGGELLGYTAGHLTRRFGTEGELQYLFVAPSARRLGVGRALVASLARWFIAHNARHVCVNVDTGSPGAVPFYRDLGATALRPHWMEWRDVAVVLDPPHQDITP